MATIEVLGWKQNFGGFTGWDEHAKSELRKRLRRGLKRAPGEIRRLARQIDLRQPVCLQYVHDEAVYGLMQILQAAGADVRVSLEDSDTEQLFKKVPKR